MSDKAKGTLILQVTLTSLLEEAREAFCGSYVDTFGPDSSDVSSAAEEHIDATFEAHDVRYGDNGTVSVPAAYGITVLRMAARDCEDEYVRCFIESMADSLEAIAEGEKGFPVYLELFAAHVRHSA